MLILDHIATRNGLGICKRSLDVVDRAARHAVRAEHLEPFGRRSATQDRAEERHEDVTVAVARGEVHEALVAGRSARSIASQKRSHRRCFGHATMIQPSAVVKAWNGTIVWCAESVIRRGSKPWEATQAPM